MERRCGCRRYRWRRLGSDHSRRPSGTRFSRGTEGAESPTNETTSSSTGSSERPAPRHENGQAGRNLSFILEHEPDLPRCEKRFIVNRIVDVDEETKIVGLLEQAGATYFRIPFRWEAYTQASMDVTGVPERYRPNSKRYCWLRTDERERVRARLYRHKNN